MDVLKLERCTPERDTDWTVIHSATGSYLCPDGTVGYSSESAVRYRTRAEAESVAFDRESIGEGFEAVACCE